MGRVAGDKGRFNRIRRKNTARRAEMRTLAKTLRENAASAPTEKPSRSPSSES